MSVKELANQFRESITTEHQLSDMDIIRMFAKGVKGPVLDDCISKAESRNSFLKIVDELTEDE